MAGGSPGYGIVRSALRSSQPVTSRLPPLFLVLKSNVSFIFVKQGFLNIWVGTSMTIFALPIVIENQKEKPRRYPHQLHIAHPVCHLFFAGIKISIWCNVIYLIGIFGLLHYPANPLPHYPPPLFSPPPGPRYPKKGREEERTRRLHHPGVAGSGPEVGDGAI